MDRYRVISLKTFFLIVPLFLGSFFSVFHTEYLKHILSLEGPNQALFAALAFCILGFWWSINWRFYETIGSGTTGAVVYIFVSKTTLPWIACSNLLQEIIHLLSRPKLSSSWVEHIAFNIDGFNVLMSASLFTVSAAIHWHYGKHTSN
ncbi:hypothetical protein ACED30_15480 [Vibrio splendidus]|uniref:hypothetical protein n=1 Tax=Vibrio splendidus TaxID=29497 RepID=UPI000C85BAE4|nr:hypothetical protein [Vibrio splendidus]PMH66898.1 hypothetical protein BCU61_03965 [Vibrio splendidus]PMN83454.1 hypothetical protein BCT24_11490 [Vibrio splendidus]